VQHYFVQISPTAKTQIDEVYSYIFDASPQNANAWLTNIYRKIDSLETMPQRCGLIRENESFQGGFHELLFYSHRIIFMINEDSSKVSVVSVRHGAKDELKGFEF